MAKHTPGLWKIEEEYFPGIDSVDPPFTIILFGYAEEDCGIRGRTPEEIWIISFSAAKAQANARLIAAAPDLLAALKNIIQIGKRDMSNPKYDGYFEAARAAIAKAEGE
jgi:hypothetical protein